MIRFLVLKNVEFLSCKNLDSVQPTKSHTGTFMYSMKTPFYRCCVHNALYSNYLCKTSSLRSLMLKPKKISFLKKTITFMTKAFLTNNGYNFSNSSKNVVAKPNNKKFSERKCTNSRLIWMCLDAHSLFFARLPTCNILYFEK